MVSLGGVATIIKRIIFILLFILFIPGFFFEIPKNGSQISVAAVHGLLYSLVFVLLEVAFNIVRIIRCVKSGGMGSV